MWHEFQYNNTVRNIDLNMHSYANQKYLADLAPSRDGSVLFLDVPANDSLY